MKEKKRPLIIVEEAQFVEVSLSLNAVSSDSIVATVSIFNSGDDSLLVYKPLLPGALSYDVFGVLTYPESETIDYIKPKREEYDYYEDGVFEYLIPNMKMEEFEQFAPHETKLFSENIAHNFNLSKFLKRGKQDFSIVYSVYVPLIQNKIHVKRVDKIDGASKPVYLFITSKENDSTASRRVKFTIPT